MQQARAERLVRNKGFQRRQRDGANEDSDESVNRVDSRSEKSRNFHDRADLVRENARERHGVGPPSTSEETRRTDS